ncbi:MAG TPA: hypothetical protein DEG28_01030 [Porphyromonadaceae bacterium]|nr:hypothetical protein [Porphyromonadaceae bacterium]
MKTVYTAIMARLKKEVKELRWIDLDTGQLERVSALNQNIDRPAIAFPCALIVISIPGAEDITDFDQDCDARITVRLAFNQEMRTSADAPPAVAPAALKPYDIIADTYAALQGWSTPDFEPLSRMSQQKENSRNGLFIYQIVFRTAFEDQTASQ